MEQQDADPDHQRNGYAGANQNNKDGIGQISFVFRHQVVGDGLHLIQQTH